MEERKSRGKKFLGMRPGNKTQIFWCPKTKCHWKKVLDFGFLGLFFINMGAANKVSGNKITGIKENLSEKKVLSLGQFFLWL